MCNLLFFKVIYIELFDMQVPFKFNLNRMKMNVNLFHVNPLYYIFIVNLLFHYFLMCSFIGFIGIDKKDIKNN